VKTTTSPVIYGVGARSPLGLSALQVAMGARAQKLEPRSTDYHDRKGCLIGAARAECLADDVVGWDRFAALGAPALREAAYGQTARFPLILALPDRGRPDQSAHFEDALITELGRRSGAAIDRRASMTVRADNAGFALALEEAANRLAAGAPGVLVGGLDSYYEFVIASEMSARSEALRVEHDLRRSLRVPRSGQRLHSLGNFRRHARSRRDDANPAPLVAHPIAWPALHLISKPSRFRQCRTLEITFSAASVVAA
jgi:hypothetical protein